MKGQRAVCYTIKHHYLNLETQLPFMIGVIHTVIRKYRTGHENINVHTQIYLTSISYICKLVID